MSVAVCYNARKLKTPMVVLYVRMLLINAFNCIYAIAMRLTNAVSVLSTMITVHNPTNARPLRHLRKTNGSRMDAKVSDYEVSTRLDNPMRRLNLRKL